MHEMLGNQLFLARKYPEATQNLEITFSKDPGNKAVHRKLIICYTQIGQVNKALDLFIELMKKDIRFIIDIDPLDEDCPCSELVHVMEKKLSFQQDSLDYHIILGILYLFCDVAKSLYYFQKVQTLNPQDVKIHWIIKKLINYQQRNTYNQNKENL